MTAVQNKHGSRYQPRSTPTGEPVCPAVSVVVPVRDDLQTLARCLEALAAQSYPRNRFETVVVDNGSTSDLRSVRAQFPWIRLLREHTPGSYAARNAGVRAARGELIAFTDADCIPETEWLERGVRRFMDEPECGLVGGRIVVTPKGTCPENVAELFEIRTALLQDEYIGVGGFAATANLITSKRVMDDVGLFDTDFKSTGDAEWSRRVCSGGYRVVYAREAVVCHPARRSLRAVLSRARRLAGGYEGLNRRAGTFYIGPARLDPPNGRRIRIDLLPPLRASAKVLRDPGILKVSSRLKLVGVLFLVQYVQVWESLWLKLGAEAQR